MAVKRDVKVDDEEGVIEGADSRRRCEASSEQFSEFELSPEVVQLEYVLVD